jgi:ABC-type transport system substrate-binding protein
MRQSNTNRPAKAIWRERLLATLFAIAVAAVPASASKYLNRGNGAEPKGLDPHQASGDPENQILGDMFIGLYTDDVNGKAVLGAAEKVETSADGLTWTFTLRDHKWSDGKPVTAGDFVFAYRRVLDPVIASEYASIMFPIKNAEKVSTGKLKTDQLGVAAPNPKTFVITLEHPAPYLPEMLTHYTTFPLPKHAVEKAGKDWTKPGIMVSNGAYKLAARRPNDHIKLVRNPLFFDNANVKTRSRSTRPPTKLRRSSAIAPENWTRLSAGRSRNSAICRRTFQRKRGNTLASGFSTPCSTCVADRWPTSACAWHWDLPSTRQRCSATSTLARSASKPTRSCRRDLPM